eukprot:g152.t1
MEDVKIKIRWHPDKNVGDEVRASEMSGKQADARLRRALDDLEAAQPKLEESEAQINDLLHGQVMKVRFALPRLEPESFQEVLAQEELRGVVRSMREMGFASAMSLAVLMALSYSSMDLRVASLISGIFSMLVQFVAFAQTWSKQVSWMFQAFNGATSAWKVAQPLEALESAIDRLDMEQALVMKRMKEFEGQVREAIPDFDVPSVEEMREPIVDCHGQIGSFLEETKGALPEELQELIGRHPMGKLVWQRASFECRFESRTTSGSVRRLSRRGSADYVGLGREFEVHFPLILVFLLNLGLLILCQVAVCHAMEHPNAGPGRPATPAPTSGWATVLWPLPCLLQVLSSALELLAGLYFTRASRLLLLEKGCNAWIEKHRRGISAEVFGTFGQVHKRAERFFPIFRLRMGQLRSFLLTGAKAEKANGVFGRAGSLFPEN